MGWEYCGGVSVLNIYNIPVYISRHIEKFGKSRLVHERVPTSGGCIFPRCVAKIPIVTLFFPHTKFVCVFPHILEQKSWLKSADNGYSSPKRPRWRTFLLLEIQDGGGLARMRENSREFLKRGKMADHAPAIYTCNNIKILTFYQYLLINTTNIWRKGER